MTKRLVLMRHAKSDWEADYGADHDRPLSSRGRRAAPRMGSFLTAAGWQPDVVLSSSALRAQCTAALATAAGGWPCEVQLDARLYGASVRELIEVIRERAIGDTVLAIGHEPVWSAAVGVLCGGGAVRMPTAAVAGIRFAADGWSLRPGTGTLRFLVPPRMLRRSV